jgi:hypothetical protein
MDYLSLGAFAFMQTFNSVVWGSLYALSLWVAKPSPLIAPALSGFAFVGWAHANLDLHAGARDAVALAFIPLHALPIIGVAFLLSVLVLGRGPITPRPRRISSHGGNDDKTIPERRGQPAGPGAFSCDTCGAVVKFGASHCRVCERRFEYPAKPADESQK